MDLGPIVERHCAETKQRGFFIHDGSLRLLEVNVEKKKI